MPSILKIARMGHPILRQKARELTLDEIQSPEIHRLILDMIETLRDSGGIGLAAPQVHQSLQLAIIEIDQSNASQAARYKEVLESGTPLEVYINPKITILDSTEQLFWEGCLSVPELRGQVPRPRKIRVEYLDRNGQPQEVIAEGFRATVLQHELDHLWGTLYVHRIRDLRKFMFVEEFNKHREAWGSADSSLEA